MINILCDRALLIGYADHLEQINLPEIRRASKEVQRHRPGFSLQLPVLGLLLLIPFFFLGLWILPRLEKTPEQEKTVLLSMKLDRFTREILPELRRSTTDDNLRTVVNLLLALWGGEPILVTAATMEESLNLSREQQFEVARLQGDLDGLLRLRLPLLLEVVFASEVRYLLLLGQDEDGMRVALNNGKTLRISPAELAPYWKNRAYLLWKNPLRLPIGQGPLQTTHEILALQTLLRGAGKSVPHNGRYDNTTRAAIRVFQTEQQLPADGIAGLQTLIALYRENPQYDYPLQTVRGEK
jgi:hypothetical protein